MWVYVCFLILFLYAIVLTVLYALRRRQLALRTVVLRIAADYPPATLEWLLYSFRCFLQNLLPYTVWRIEVSEAAPPEQYEILQHLMGRFAYQLHKCYNQHETKACLYVFTAEPDSTAADWQWQLKKQLELG